jgi:hypothetical protein
MNDKLPIDIESKLSEIMVSEMTKSINSDILSRIMTLGNKRVAKINSILEKLKKLR